MGAEEKQDTASDRYLEPSTECVLRHARHTEESRHGQVNMDDAIQTTTGCEYIQAADLATSYRSAMGRAEMTGIRCEGIVRLPLGKVSA